MSAYTVGQEVNIHYNNNYYRPSVRRGVVVKVGRKYVSVKPVDGGDRQAAQYHLDTGSEKTDYTIHRWIATDEQDAERERIEAAQERLTAAGIRLSQPHGFGTVKLTVAQWEAIADIVAPGGAA